MQSNVIYVMNDDRNNIKIYIEKIYDNDQDVFITKNSLQIKGLRNFFQYNIVDLLKNPHISYNR